MACCDCACVSVEDLKRCLPDALAIIGGGFSNQQEVETVANALFNCAKECPEGEE